MTQRKALVITAGHQEYDELDATDIPALSYDADGAAAAAQSAAATDATTKANAAQAAAIAASLGATAAAGGDLSGNYPNPSVVDDSHSHGSGTAPGTTPPAFATPALTLGTANAAGAAGTVIRSDATLLAFDATVPVTQASADVAATGAATTAARRDHKHGMPTLSGAAGGTPATVIGTAGSAGSAGTFLRTDDTLGILDATVPTTSALGDAAATGSVAKAARRDHAHGREASGTTAAAIGTSAGGSATTPSKSDHVHATGAGTPSTQAFGDAAATGTGPAAAMTDHKHAMPASPTLGLFGTGTDGALTLTQSTAAPAYATKSGAGATTLFTLIRDVYATDFTLDDVNGNFLVKTAGFRIFASGTFLIDAGVTVHHDGNAAVANTAGQPGAGGTVGATTSGTAGTAGIVGSGSGATPSAISRAIASEATAATVQGGRGGNETGGGTGAGAGLGGSQSNDPVNGNPRNLWQAISLNTPAAQMFQGGSGGSGGDSTASSTSGAGGGGGGIVAIYAKTLINNGLIRALGGNGGNASGAGTGAGGGGGGGGGAIVLLYVAAGSTVGSTSVAGGTGGTLQGAGAAGANGNVGLVWLYPL